MKVAILTQPLGKNYGGIMQGWALQQVLKKLGHEVVTIDYNYPAPGFFYKQARLGYRLIKKIAGKRVAPINFEEKFSFVFQHTHAFINENITMSEYIDSNIDLKQHFEINKYDAVVVGSDQTWRPKYSPNIYNFYLDFIKNKNIKRFAYASSFGVDTWEYSEEETSKCAELAKLFDAISVREESGVDLCKKYLNVESECVLDPTLLLNKEDYLSLIGDKYNNGSYNGVYTYFLDANQEKTSAANFIAEKLKIQVYSCQAKRSLGDLGGSTLDEYQMPAVQDWLASFANAKFVVTDSFHGMVFSIVFGKPFIVIANKERGAARFESLLKKFNASDKLIDSTEVLMKGLVKVDEIKPLDFKSIELEKEKSLFFLKKYL